MRFNRPHIQAITISIIIIFVLSVSVGASEREKLPNANNFKYPPHEVKFIDDFKNSFNNCEDKVDFINQFFRKNDIKKLKHRYYFYEIIFIMESKLEAETNLMERPGIKDFIVDAENLKICDEDASVKKLKAWIYLLSTFGKAKISWSEKKKNIERGNKILLELIEANKEFRPLATFLLVERVFYGEESIKMKLLKRIIDENIFEEYCAEAKIKYAQWLFHTSHSNKDWEKAEKMCFDIFIDYDNFYTGYGDLYTDAYQMIFYFDRKLYRYKREEILKKMSNKKSLNRTRNLSM